MSELGVGAAPDPKIGSNPFDVDSDVLEGVIHVPKSP